MKRLAALAVVVAIVALTIAPAHSIPFYYSAGNLSAEAMFVNSGDTLTVTLTNTSTHDALVPRDILTAVFFTVGGNPTLTSVSADLASGSSVWQTNRVGSGNNTTYVPEQVPVSNVGGEWAYADLNGTGINGSDDGISSTGVGLFGAGTFFNFTNLQGPDSVNGLQYGIAPSLQYDDLLTGNGGFWGTALIHNSVTFTFTGLDPSATFEISNVQFLYGTSLPADSVPEPGTLLLLGSGLFGLGLMRRRKTNA